MKIAVPTAIPPPKMYQRNVKHCYIAKRTCCCKLQITTNRTHVMSIALEPSRESKDGTPVETSKEEL
jgi:hypothetical protein